MRLDLSNLTVESFATATPIESEPVITIDTGKGGPESYCYICYPTGNTDPACQPIDPETRFYPCTQAHQSTCVGCV